MGDLAKKLSEAAGSAARIGDFDGQVLNVLSIDANDSPFPDAKAKGQKQVVVTALDADGNEVTFFATPTAGRQLIAIEDDLPQELLIVSFPGQFGKTGYKFEEAE